MDFIIKELSDKNKKKNSQEKSYKTSRMVWIARKY